jgi:hypothetical protein
MRIRFGVLLLAMSLSIVGCSDDKKKIDDAEPDPYMKQTSIANCLFNLKLSYTQRNVAKYSSLFDEQYTYVFDPRDVGTHGIPETWGRSDELLSATHLLDSLQNSDGYVCEHISLNFIAGADVASEVEPAWRKVTLTQITLLVDCRHQDTGEPLRYEMIGDQADIHFIQTAETDPSSGLRIWKIIYWVDKPIGAKVKTEPTTWGRIKANWR